VPNEHPIATISDVLDDAAHRFADREAMRTGDAPVSYVQLQDGVSRLAGWLLSLDLAAGDRVALLAPNGPIWIWLTFALARAGLILVPLNGRLSAKELDTILEAASARVLFVDPIYEATACELRNSFAQPRIVWTASFGAELRSHGEGEGVRPLDLPACTRQVCTVDPSAVAHLYFTSGTTGQPKGVMLTHRNVVLHAQRAVRALTMGQEDTWAHIAPMFHLADAWATVAGTLCGLRHVFLPRFEANAALDLIENERVTITNLVPTMLNVMAAEPGVNRRDFSSLRIIMSGGAPIAPSLVGRLIDLFKCEYVQTYGMTETSPYLTLGLLPEHLLRRTPKEQLTFKAKTGRPFPGIELRVVDSKGNPVPSDNESVGEIEVRGETVTPGYWNAPELTQEAFTPDGFLRTGDLAVIDHEGFVNIVDRKKDMIITGGENVYCTEVEAVLAAHPAILEVAVFGEPDPRWGERVCAAVVLRQGQTVDAESLIQFCRPHLAGYKLPRSVQFLSELPKTGSGKISKRLLRSD
jgi:acyl-CoA synthetase (AMP-forming)/AMP-acid ligase II